MNLLTAAGNIISTARNVNGDSEKWYLFNKDDQVSTKSIIDDGGNRAIAYEYDEYGNITEQAGEGINNEVGYPLNYYTYCAGDPVNYTDPTGHSFKKRNKKNKRRFGRKRRKSKSGFKRKRHKAREKKAGRKKRRNAKRKRNSYNKNAQANVKKKGLFLKFKSAYNKIAGKFNKYKTKASKLLGDARKKAVNVYKEFKANPKGTATNAGRKAIRSGDRLFKSTSGTSFMKTASRYAVGLYAQDFTSHIERLEAGVSTEDSLSEAFVDTMFTTAGIGVSIGAESENNDEYL